MHISGIENRKFGIYPIGLQIRGKLNSEFIYRYRAGNGYFGSLKNVKYQDKYAYFVPGSINNPESEPYRTQLRSAVSYWQKTLTDEEKKEYNKRANKNYQMSGYNLFIKEAMKGEYSMYVDRDNIAVADFETADFTIDGAWNDLNLSAIITVQARIMLMTFVINQSNPMSVIMIRKKGETGIYSAREITVSRSGQDVKIITVLSPDQNRTIQYNIPSPGVSKVELAINGWWT